MMDSSNIEGRLILEIKRRGGITMQEVAEVLGMSKMGAYKHLLKLEGSGLIGRRIVKKSVGRPIHLFYLTDKGKQYFGSADSVVLGNLLEFLKSRGAGGLVSEFLRERYAKLAQEYAELFAGKTLEEKVSLLSELRSREGYMAELRRSGRGFELLEYSCPIFKVASVFGEACHLEAKLFSRVLGVDVENTHRQVDECSVCRFLLKPKTA
ncbi:transcriptional regulator [Candidatus Marsarchaeota G2 archaeon OSP_D]|jgi:DeoR family suf operon transcriptional repressor|uniref:Transcriptional regulator n=2 Tax=Candidatus Marsarchaeota group 2 TaxID=2203771 RepID=A0A2R6CBX4_9ARCH|nr:MAG: transcriptional regulator [Candidatus Marsarchaeota G2 archaeon OSP_D]PSO08412.1 MAG: transcriptional regulator [Candidatus Marsarchaeota G2 archaeon BE_D]